MKAWFNEKGNWCFEFERSEIETTRMSMLISRGTTFWRDEREKYPKAYISAELLNKCIDVVIIGQNYSQKHPTIDDPMIATSLQLAESEVSEEQKYPSTSFNERELRIIKKHLKENEFYSLL